MKKILYSPLILLIIPLIPFLILETISKFVTKYCFKGLSFVIEAWTGYDDSTINAMVEGYINARK